MKTAPLVVLVTGVQGTGKSRVADAAGRRLNAAVLGHDWAMSGLSPYPELQEALDAMNPTGHRVAGWSILCALARSELRRGRSVVLDGVARREEIAACRRLTEKENGRFLLVATECSDVDLHRQRVEGRQRLIPGWYELTWEHVERTRQGWETPRTASLVLDAAQPWEDNESRLGAVLAGAEGSSTSPPFRPQE